MIKKLSILQKRFQEFFLDKLHSYGVETPAQLSKKEKSEFFTSIKNEWPSIKHPPKSTISEDNDISTIKEKVKSRRHKKILPYNMHDDNLQELVEQVFSDHKLIGNYDFSEDEYAFMIDFVSGYSREFLIMHNAGFHEQSFKMIFATIVEAAKRWKNATTKSDDENSGYREYIIRTLLGEFYSSSHQGLYNELTNICKQESKIQ